MINQKFKEIFKKGSTTFYTSSLFFTGQAKEDVYILYAFVRTADDFVDKIPQDKYGLDKFKQEYREVLRGKSTENIIISSMVSLMKRIDIKEEWVEAFLNVMTQDLSKKTYSTNEEVEEYVYGSAAVIGLMMARILNLPESSYEYAKHLGRAFQFINFIRDVKEDISLGRNYFPQTEIKESGITDYSVESFKANPENFKNLIKLQLLKYLAYKNGSRDGFKLIPKKYRIAIQTATDMYDWTARVIEKNPMVVLEKKVKPSKFLILLYGFKNILFA